MNPFAILKHLQPCLICGENPIVQHGACKQCWDELPWQNCIVKRHDLECFICLKYRFPMDHILHQFKDNAAMHYLPLLQSCLAQYDKPKIQAIVPMPISTEKLIQRGFNQTLLLAEGLSSMWNIPIWQPIERQHKHSQRGLDRMDRLNNLQDSFYSTENPAKYKHVLIIDDVVTTGTSLLMLKQALENLGCTHVYALSLCG